MRLCASCYAALQIYLARNIIQTGRTGEADMNPVVVRDVRIGEGIPKICVPITGTTREEIIEEAGMISSKPADMAEWRADWYEDIFDVQKVREVLRCLRESLQEMPILFTFRTKGEGGERDIDAGSYMKINKAAIASGYIDLADVELFSGDETVRELIEEAHRLGVKVVLSNNDFEKTQEKDEIVSRLRRMQKLGADLLKIAVMPGSTRDVLILLEATEEMRCTYADRPLITMSMSQTGMISRLCGEVFGSAVTFGAVGKASAPGQIRAEKLKDVLELIHGTDMTASI